MSEYQIPKTRVDVDVILQNNLELAGSIYISDNVMAYRGKPRLEDFLNTGERFFPFSGDDGITSLLNKRRLILLRSNEDDRDFLETTLMLQPRLVRVQMVNDLTVEGAIYSNLPKESLRVSDYFNQKEFFLPIYDGDTKTIVNSAEILYVND